MSEKPILFNTDMVQAILDDRKIVTRRVIKPTDKKADHVEPLIDAYTGRFLKMINCNNERAALSDIRPPYKKGDYLYVREAWAKDCFDNYVYRADFVGTKISPEWKWKPSIHMPKEAARIWLRVINVMVEPLQDITVDGCKAEGIYDDYKTLSPEYHDMLMEKAYPDTFKKLWNSTIKKQELDSYGWDSNPWVWVIEFERIEREVQSGSCE